MGNKKALWRSKSDDEATYIQIRIKAGDRKKFEEFCEAKGITPTIATNMLIKKTLADGKLPFDI